MNYCVSSSSPTDELLTLGRIFSEVGGYASTILDREHILFSRKCETRLNRVVEELVSRRSILSAENLHDLPESAPAGTDLKTLSISELHTLYRRWPIRHDERRAKGRESLTFYFEGTIVNELRSRKATNKAEQFKIDYCTAIYDNEISNIEALFSLPVRIDKDKIYPDNERVYRAEELTALISLYKDYRDITEREILVEYVDRALDLLEEDKAPESCIGLLTELAEIGRKQIIRVPLWVTNKLEEALLLSTAKDVDSSSDIAPALLTMHLTNNDPALERKSQRIINRCYKSAFDTQDALGKRIENLHTAVTCCDYVTRFSVRKSADLWNGLSSQVLSSNTNLSPRHLFQLLETAKECEDYADISVESKNKLKHMLDGMATPDCPEVQSYSKISGLRF